MIGKLAYSKAGHDKHTLYMIVGEDAESVYLCDGRLRTVDHPKRKNKKHIQLKFMQILIYQMEKEFNIIKK